MVSMKSVAMFIIGEACAIDETWFVFSEVYGYLLSYPQPPNLCTEAVIDRVMRTWILGH